MSFGIVIFHGLIVPPVHFKDHLGNFWLSINRDFTNYTVPADRPGSLLH